MAERIGQNEVLRRLVQGMKSELEVFGDGERQQTRRRKSKAARWFRSRTEAHLIDIT